MILKKNCSISRTVLNPNKKICFSMILMLSLKNKPNFKVSKFYLNSSVKKIKHLKSKRKRKKKRKEILNNFNLSMKLIKPKK
jgi:hypothetical protein